jgi:lipopolysaccharide biosynthesis protein
MSGTIPSAQIGASDLLRTGPSRPKLIAFYLPQYHPIPENDAWWGKGFTEWTNVVNAKPLFRGHHQPNLPADLGFYDLRLAETREAQADLAAQHGIHGFCYYHYWFRGRRLLERPFNDVLASGRPHFPFCLCWANENWTRRWDGLEREVLIEQTYSDQDDISHIRWLLGAFADHRYIRVEGKPLFLVYRAGDLPNAARTAETWRTEALRAGIGDIFLCSVATVFKGSPSDPRLIGFDAAVEFQPAAYEFPRRPLIARAWKRLARGVSGHVKLKYADLVDQALRTKQPPYLWFRCVLPSWDNTPRRKTNALIIEGSSPKKYGEWLEATIEQSPHLASGEKLVFVNAWNEWAEGNHLEPSQRWGRAFLEITRSVMERAASRVEGQDVPFTSDQRVPEP